MDEVRYSRAGPAGTWWVAWTRAGVCAGAAPEWTEEQFVDWLGRLHEGDIVPGDPSTLPAGIDWRFVRPGFRRRVLEACAAIPEGETRTYGELAAEAGSPRAARAVGSAMAANPLAPVVPCHRVVRGDGVLGAYSAGGPRRKAEMLRREGVDVVEGRVIR